jgi:hypothetical protein
MKVIKKKKKKKRRKERKKKKTPREGEMKDDKIKKDIFHESY